MPVSGLVITLCEDLAQRDDALEKLAREPRIVVGTAVDHHLPIVTETKTVFEARQLHEWIERLEGVLVASVVTLDLSDHDEDDEEGHCTDATS